MRKTICVIDCGTIWVKEIRDKIEKCNYLVEVISLDNFGDEHLEKCSGVVISGASILLTEVDVDEYLEKFQFLKNIKVPVLGICFGHQMMGMVYGAGVYIRERVDKMESMEIINQDKLFDGLKEACVFKEEHSEYISLPDEFKLLAKSESCENEIMKHRNKDLYGVQFHPEVSGNCGEVIFRNFLKSIER